MFGINYYLCVVRESRYDIVIIHNENRRENCSVSLEMILITVPFGYCNDKLPLTESFWAIERVGILSLLLFQQTYKVGGLT